MRGLFRVARPRLSCGVANVQNLDRIVAYAIENLVRIAQYQDSADVTTLDDPRCAKRPSSYAFHDALCPLRIAAATFGSATERQ